RRLPLAGSQEFAWERITFAICAAGLEEKLLKGPAELEYPDDIRPGDQLRRNRRRGGARLSPGSGRDSLECGVQPERSACALWRRGAGNRKPRASGNTGWVDRARLERCKPGD